MANVMRFKQTGVPRQNGELARLKVVHGTDYGTTFVLVTARAQIGRGDDCEVMLADLKASRRHAELFREAAGWSVKDSGSANGILCNGQPTRFAKLKTGDTITLGETMLEFASSEAATQMLSLPPKSMEQVLAGQAALALQREKVHALGRMSPAAPSAASGSAGGGKKNLLLGAGLALAAFMFLSESPTPKKSGAKKKSATRDIAAVTPPNYDTLAAPDKAAESFFRLGFREYRERNFLRAQIQFETALQVSPSHRLARIYLENCNRSIKSEVDHHLEHGKKSHHSGKLKEAISHYEAVLRLLSRDQVNPNYIEARDQLSAVTLDLNGGSSG